MSRPFHPVQFINSAGSEYCIGASIATIEFVSGCEDERHAARVLGYDRYSWKSAEIYQPAFTGKTWREMTAEERTALLVLGYSEYTWETREPVSSYKYWGGLTDEEKTAAEVLGYKAVRWNDRAGTAKQPKFVNKDWAELTQDEQNALEVLGYTETLWDGGTSSHPQSFTKDWDELTVCGQDISLIPDAMDKCLKAMNQINPVLLPESTKLCAFLPVRMRLNSRQVARMNKMLRVSWDMTQSLGNQHKCSSPLLTKTTGSR